MIAVRKKIKNTNGWFKQTFGLFDENVANNSVGQQTKVSTQNVTQCLLCFNVLSLCLINVPTVCRPWQLFWTPLGRHAASLSCTAA